MHAERNKESFSSVKCTKEKTQPSLTMTKEMPWCCIYVQYIIQILLSKIYDKEVVQSPFLG